MPAFIELSLSELLEFELSQETQASPDVTLALIGSGMTAQAGAVSESLVVGLAGALISVAAGDLGKQTQTALAGLQTNSQVGALTANRAITLSSGQILVAAGALTKQTQTALEGAMALAESGSIVGRLRTESSYRVAIQPAVSRAYVPVFDGSANVPAMFNRAVVPAETEAVLVTD
jgi:hypothetical protein